MRALRERLVAGQTLLGAASSLALGDLARRTRFGDKRAALAGRSVLVRTRDQLSAALALIELDGLVRRLILCPPDFDDAHLAAVVAAAEIDAIVFDGAPPPGAEGLFAAPLEAQSAAIDSTPAALASEWVMFTSGTTGVPKMVVHSLAGLTGAIASGDAAARSVVWGTFYDIRRYGGLQILLRALIGGGSMILSDADETAADYLARLGRHGVTNLSGTPSHWRRALMSGAIDAIDPAYVRLSGEIADQSVLDSLKAAFPNAAIGHAYASTEAGVGFEVNDGLEGFPASLVDRTDGPIAMRVEDGSLRIRSSRTATRYLAEGAQALADAEGYVDTGDMVDRRGDRFYFVGRRGGIINVGGLKVQPEEIEAVINRHPAIQMSLVRGRRNPITGQIAVAEVVLKDAARGSDEAERAIREAVMQACRDSLAPFKVPASVRIVPALAVTASGKLERPLA